MEDANNLLVAFDDPKTSLYSRVFLSFNDLQRRLDKDSWFSSWIDLEDALASHLWSREVTSIHKFCSLFIQTETKGYPSRMDQWWHKSLQNYLKPPITEFDCNVLGHLLTADSVEDFAKDLRLSIADTEVLLRRIYSKSRILLDDSNK